MFLFSNLKLEYPTINNNLTMEGKESNCIICYKSQANESSLKLNATESELQSKNEISDQLKVIFIVRNLLKVPSSICEEFLKDNGSPCSWIKTCSDCSILVDDAFSVNCQINTLRKQIEKLSQKFRNEIKDTFNGNASKSSGKRRYRNSITHSIRNWVVKDVNSGQENDEKTEKEFNAFNNPPPPKRIKKSKRSSLLIEDIKTLSSLEEQLKKEEPAWIEEVSIKQEIIVEEDCESFNLQDNTAVGFLEISTEPGDESYRPKPRVVDPERWKCFDCVEKFALETERDDHFESSHPDIQKPECPATCVKCKKGYISKMELTNHYYFNHKRVRVENEDATKTLRCDKCKFGRRYATEEELQIHIRRTHDGDKVPYKCLTCAKGCHSSGSLRIHMQKHTGERLFMCKICSKTFRQNKSLIFHLIRDHKQEAGQELDSESLRCDECDKLFSSKQYVRLHKLTVHEKKFKHLCNICGMGTQNASNLKVHIKTHDKSHIKSLSNPRKQLGGNRVFKRKKTTHSTNIKKRRNARKRKSPTPSSSEQDESEMEMDELDTHSDKEMQEEKSNIPITKQEETSVPVSVLKFASIEVCDFDGSSLSKVDDSDYLLL